MAPTTVIKQVKHTFTLEERDVIGGELARALGTLRGVENEFEQVKASYKSKTAEAEALIGSLETKRMNGFELRQERCRVVFFPKESKKRFWLEHDPDDAAPVLIEDMTNEDFQADLIQAESKFEHREELPLFEAGADRGILAVGRFNKSWYAALRVKVGKHSLDERLDSEQPCCKQRIDAIGRALKAFNEWLVKNIGKDAAAGFKKNIDDLLASQKEREE